MKNPLFPDFPPADQAAIAEMATMMRLPIGQRLMRQGSHGRDFAVLLEGECSVFVDGEQHGRLVPGDFFGELALLPDVSRSNGLRMATVIALTDVEIAVFARPDFLGMYERYEPMRAKINAQVHAFSGAFAT